MKKLKVYLLITMVTWIFCSDYNPFENPANVKMVIVEEGNSIVSDTVASIFSSETLYVAGAVREEIDSFSISVNKNKYFLDTTIVAPIIIGNYKFPFSFIDTGHVTISLTTFRKNGDDVNEDIELFVSNPLSQDTVLISESSVENLFTNPVSDSGVRYFWSFSSVGEELFTLSQTSNQFTGNITEFDDNGSTGFLWVVDIMGNQSPQRSFVYKFVDSSGPVISCDNEGYNSNTNVIVTGDKTFRFQIRCNDLAGVNTAVVNDSSFTDYEMKSSKEFVFYKSFYNMDTLSDSIILVVNASDKSNHLSSKTFYLKYDVLGPKEVFHLISPVIQPYVTGTNKIDIQMEVYNLFTSPIIVSVNHIEGGVLDTLDTINVSDTSTLLKYSVNLLTGDNLINFKAVDSLGDSIQKTVQITYSSGVEDTTKPFIIKSTVNGFEGEDIVIKSDTAILELSAYDENLDSVIINGELKLIDSTYNWQDTVILSSGREVFNIRLVDNFGNATTKDIWVQKNTTPYIVKLPQWPKTLVIGTPWRDTITISDEDGDSVSLIHQLRKLNTESPNNSSFNNLLNGLIQFHRISRLRWGINWSGNEILDTLKGRKITTEIIIDDLKSDTTYNWDFSIVDSANAKPYDFTVTLPDFIDTTAEGAIDLTQILDTVVLNGFIESNSQTIGETDTITLIFNEQIVKYNSTNGIFDIVIDVGEKAIDEESIIIIVSDTLGYVSVVDTLDIIYSIELHDTLISKMAWRLNTDMPEAIQITPVDTGDLVEKWIGEGVEFIENSNVGDYPFNATLVEDSILEKEVIHFSSSGKNTLYNTNNLSDNSFTLIIVGRLGRNYNKDSSYCLISASDISKYTGFGVEGGKFAMMGDSSVEIKSASELRGGPYVYDNEWHIFTISSGTGIVNNNSGIDSINVFYANLWLDGIKTNCDSCVSVGTPESYPYTVIGGGGKHRGFKSWEGDVAEIIQFDHTITKSEMNSINAYLASEYKIDINKFTTKNVQIKRQNY